MSSFFGSSSSSAPAKAPEAIPTVDPTPESFTLTEEQQEKQSTESYESMVENRKLRESRKEVELQSLIINDTSYLRILQGED